MAQDERTIRADASNPCSFCGSSDGRKPSTDGDNWDKLTCVEGVGMMCPKCGAIDRVIDPRLSELFGLSIKFTSQAMDLMDKGKISNPALEEEFLSFLNNMIRAALKETQTKRLSDSVGITPRCLAHDRYEHMGRQHPVQRAASRIEKWYIAGLNNLINRRGALGIFKSNEP